MPSSSATRKEHELIRLAVIGCGFQGSFHAANIVANPGTELAVCCDLDIALAEALSHKHGGRSTNDVASVVSDPTIDAVVVATTTNTHADLAIAAAANGKHVLLEKPMALTVAECLAIERAVAAASVTLLIGFKFRFTTAARAARRAVPNPIVLTAHTLYDLTQDTSSWVNDRALSGGRVMSSLVHSVDLLRYLAGAEVTLVSAAGGNLAIEGLNDIDNVVATMTFDNGAVASLVHGTAGESPLLSVWSFQTAGRGSNATIYAHGRRALIHHAASTREPEEVIDPTEDRFAAGTPEMLQAFLDAIESGDASSGGPRDGTMSVLVCRAIEEAIASGEPQPIPLPNTLD